MPSALENLLAHSRQTVALSQVSMLISWDQETQMPPAGATIRAEQSAALARVLQERRADPRIGEWIDAIDLAALTDVERCNVEEARRIHEHAVRIPADLAGELAHAASRGQQIWGEARKRNDFAMFAPALKHMIALRRDYAARLARDGMSAYDALLDDYEPDTTAAEIEPLLESLRPALTALRERIAGKPRGPKLKGRFDRREQFALSRRIAKLIGYDFGAGRLDLAVHPFSSGSPCDARITTRTDEADPFGAIYSTIHEVGHALYTQGQADPFLLSAEYSSMGVHESQSRFWENQIGRSRAFTGVLFGMMKESFGDFGIADADTFYAAVNRVETGFIRTEADEVHYNLHILLRFELERDLFAGRLEVEDLEEAWNERFERDFGRKVTNVSDGILQDVHWSEGYFGYFPTYSLGNIYSACLDKAMRADMPDREAMIASGETAPILEWLRERIHRKGRLYPPAELIERATGEPISPQPLIDYLNDKFGALYGL